jgi:hypothetical protein
MDNMGLWHVRVLFDLVVRAETPGDARIAAMDAVQEPMFDDEPDLTMPEPITQLRDLPKHWDGECRPYGERHPNDLTIAEQLHPANAHPHGTAVPAGTVQGDVGGSLP